jgi:hypothetical protein
METGGVDKADVAAQSDASYEKWRMGTVSTFGDIKAQLVAIAKKDFPPAEERFTTVRLSEDVLGRIIFALGIVAASTVK